MVQRPAVCCLTWAGCPRVEGDGRGRDGEVAAVPLLGQPPQLGGGAGPRSCHAPRPRPVERAEHAARTPQRRRGRAGDRGRGLAEAGGEVLADHGQRPRQGRGGGHRVAGAGPGGAVGGGEGVAAGRGGAGEVRRVAARHVGLHRLHVQPLLRHQLHPLVHTLHALQTKRSEDF